MDDRTGLEIAIIGMAVRFPGATTLAAFWTNLKEGVESITTFSNDELLAAGVDPALLTHPDFVRRGAVIADADQFDAAFFGFYPREAELIDPQQRLFLECAWEALEHAGYAPGTRQESVGVFGGVGMNMYLLNQLYTGQNSANPSSDVQMLYGNDKDFLATRISYHLDLVGPGLTVQTACSTSLVATHIACQSLLSGECNIALAGGVSVRMPQQVGYLYQQGSLLSPDGSCRAFDAQAQGTIFGNGAGIVVLKRLEDALADGDHVYAVIKGSAINNDGSLKVGYTAPSVEGQARVVRAAQIMAEVDPETITYIEAHGTGTPLGDPIEIAALTKAFRAGTQKKKYCAVGSVKTNFGHLDTAAGVAGLIKTALALTHKQIPPNLHFERPNPQIDFDNSPFFVSNRLHDWAANGAPRRAGVSSFGIGGTNAHVILEEAPQPQPKASHRTWQVLSLSAKTAAALETATENLASFLRETAPVSLADVAYTQHVGRHPFNHRRVWVGDTGAKAAQALTEIDPEQVSTAVTEYTNRPTIFMFPGGGTQYVNMGRELYQTEPIFRQHIDHCLLLLEANQSIDLHPYLYPGLNPRAEIDQKMRQTSIALPLLFTVEFALAQLWISWGIRPEALIGHSLGEYVAACVAGVFSLADALAVVTLRGRLFETLPPSAMLSVALPEEEVQLLLDEKLSLAAVNGRSLCVLGGEIADIDAVEKTLRQRDVQVRRLHINIASHSTTVIPILDEFTQFLTQLSLQPPQIPFISNLTGTWITPEEATAPSYWSNHLRHTVRFADGLAELCKEPEQVMLEVGPGRSLSSLARRHPEKSPRQLVYNSLPHAKAQSSDAGFLLKTLGRLWLAGVDVDWPTFYAHEQRHRLPLPTYPFERRRYWINGSGRQTALSAQQDEWAKRPDISDWFYTPTWKRLMLPTKGSLDTNRRQWLIFADDTGIGANMQAQLVAAEQTVIMVQPGEKFAKIGTDTYTIRPDTRTDYEMLIAALPTDNEKTLTIVHLWSVDAAESERLTSERFYAFQQRSFYSLLWLIQVLQDADMMEGLQLRVVANQLWEVVGDEVLQPEKATVAGLCRVLPWEYPEAQYQCIDITLPKPGSSATQRLQELLLYELVAVPKDTAVALRPGGRWVQDVAAIELDPITTASPRLKKGGTYLITGGLGDIGLHIARYLAQTVQANLVLTSRSGLPEREMWAAWLESHTETDSVSRKILGIQTLIELGSEVLTISADVADLPQMQAVVETTRQRFGQIHGVVHAAGTPGGGLIQLKTPSMFADAWSAKVDGALVLDALFADADLDFMAFFSSLVSIIGAFGQADYGTANTFLDAFAHYRMRRGDAFTISINWDRWQDIGMATALQAQHEEWLGEKLPEAILGDEGVQAFAYVLGGMTTQVVVSTRNLAAIIAQQDANTIAATLQELASATRTPAMHERPSLSTAYVAPRNEAEYAIADIWQDLLGIDKVGVYDDFFELGGHSLVATQIAARVREKFQVELPLHKLFDNPTVSKLALLLEQNHKNGSGKTSPGIQRLSRQQHRIETTDDKPWEIPTELKKHLSG